MEIFLRKNGFSRATPGRGRAEQSRRPGSPRCASRRTATRSTTPLLDEEAQPPGPLTRFLPDATQSILSHNDSPDVGFDTSLNPYRGCEHGCIYCYARPTHEFLGFGAGQDFETKIMIKERAPELLRQELANPRWQPRVVALSGVTDCYQPVERRLRLTRGCLEVFAEFRNPVMIITKNHLVTRDKDVLATLARHQAAAVYLSVTTLDPTLARRLEPRASPPVRRLAAVRELAQAGVPVGVLVAPIHSGPDRPRGARHPRGGGRGRGNLRGMDLAAATLRRRRSLRRMAGLPLPVEKGKGAGPPPGHARRPAQRAGIRLAHARRGPSRRTALGAAARQRPGGWAWPGAGCRSPRRRSGAPTTPS